MNLTFKTLLLVCLVPFVHPGPINVKDKTPIEDPVYKLPDGLEPSTYILTLTVDLDNVDKPDAKYKGKVDIFLDVTTDDGVTGAVKLHSYDTITLSETAKPQLVEVNLEDAQSLLDEAAEIGYDKTTNILTLNLKKGTTLAKDKSYKLTLEFEGLYRDDMNGFYRSSYVDSKGVTHWLVTTQFESVAARSAFPCFDEPRFKAHYTISVEVAKTWVDKGYHALSNTNLKRQSRLDGENTVFEFEPTPEKLASYLVAFIVSDFEKSMSPAEFNNGKPFLTWGQKRYISNNEDALSQTAGPAVLDIYADKLGIAFAYPKIDQVGIPDFSAGAMENWGLTTYRERMLFFNEESNSIATKQSTVGVTAHELAHQWFGDLVTLHSWDDIWLNEGFADFFEYHGSALINVPGLNTASWNYLGQFVVDELQSTAFEVDGLESARPLTSAVVTPDEIEANFDNIAYSKGGSVIRMWNHVLQDKVFYEGLSIYLNKYKGKNGRPEDLLAAFQEAYDKSDPKLSLNGLTVQAAFENWHKTEGYPVLTVQHVDKAKYNFTQERFLWKIDETKAEKVFSWHIPISCSTKEQPQFEKTEAADWLKNDEKVKEITFGDADAEKPTWIIINNQETGYYRVNYDEENWKALTEQLNTNYTVIHEINRAQIIDDSLSLARSTKNKDDPFLSYDIALELTKYLSHEEDYLPWAAASNGFSFLNTKLTSDESYKFFQQHVLNAVQERYVQLGLEVKTDDTHLNRLLRIVIASWACKLNHEKCVADAVTQFNDKKISPDVKSIVYCTAVRNKADAWDQVWNEYNTTDNNLDQTIFLSALGCTKDEEKLTKYLLETTKDKGMIRKQDLSSAFSSVYNGNPENVQVALGFLSSNLTNIAKYYGGMDPIGKLLIGLANKVVSANDMQVLNDTLITIMSSSDPLVQKASKSAQLAKNTLESTKHWLDSRQTSISAWLKNTYNTDDGNGGGGGGGGGAGEITVSILTVVSCLALLFSS